MGPGQTTTAPRQNLFEIGKKFREFRVLVFGPIPQGQNAELDFAEKNSASSAFWFLALYSEDKARNLISRNLSVNIRNSFYVEFDR